MNIVFWNQEDATDSKVIGPTGYFTGDMTTKVGIPLLGDVQPVPGVGTQDFTARYTGVFTVPSNGDYRFTVVAEGGATLWINGQRHINTWSTGQNGVTGTSLNTGVKHLLTGLTAGEQLSIRLDYRRESASLDPELLRLFVENTTAAAGGNSLLSAFSTCKRTNVAERKHITSITNYCQPDAGGGVTQVLVNYDRVLTSSEVNDVDFMSSIKINNVAPLSAVLDPNDNTRLLLTTNALTQNGLYTVQAGGESSYFTPALTQASGVTGLYFNQTSGSVKTFEQFGAFTGSHSVAVHPTVDLEWTSSLPAPTGTSNNFSGVIQGYLFAAFTDTYTFRTRSNDGVRVFIGKETIVDQSIPSYESNAFAVESYSVDLVQGKLYPVRVEYKAGVQDPERLILQWSRLGDPIVTAVPTSNLRTCLPDGNTTGSIDNTAVDHFAIDHDEQGIYCLAESAITVGAYDNTDSLMTGFAGTINLSTNTGKGIWTTNGTGTLSNDGNDNGEASYTFDSNDMGVASFNLKYDSGTTASQYPALVNINVVYDLNNAITEANDLDPDLVFSPQGLVMKPADDELVMIAGTDKIINITAVGQTPTQNNCDVIETYDGAKTLNFNYSYYPTVANIASSEVRPVHPTVEGNTVDQDGNNQLPLSFTNGKASINLKFKDAGRISLSAADTVDTTINGGSTASFVSRPDRIAITGVSAASALDTTEAANFTAGAGFNVTLQVLDSEDDLMPSFKETTEGLRVTHTLAAPIGGVDGTLTGGAAASWSPGVIDGEFTSSLSWDEVGFISLTASMNSSNYLGVNDLGDAVTDGTISNVGRFKPAKLGVEATVASIQLDTTSNACGFIYQTKPGGNDSEEQLLTFDSTAYPAISIKGLSATNTTTYNYAHSDFWRLNESGLLASYANTVTGQNAVFKANRNAPRVSAATNTQGYREYIYDNESFGYEKLGGTQASADLPFTPAFTMSVSGAVLTDADDVKFDPDNDDVANDFTAFDAISTDPTDPTGLPQVRYGRIIGDHVYGSGLDPMTINVTAQYWGTANARVGFITNTDHDASCSLSYTPSYMTSMASSPGMIAANKVAFTTPASWTAGISSFDIRDESDPTKGPGDDLSGRVPVTVAVPDYLEFNFDNDAGGSYDQPRASATIGISKKSDIIFQRQGYR